jgi:hypothetical protein
MLKGTSSLCDTPTTSLPVLSTRPMPNAFMRKYSNGWMSLHPEKTRLIEFGRFAAENRAKRGLGKPEHSTFSDLRTSADAPDKANSSFNGNTPRPDACQAAENQGRAEATECYE